MGVDIAMVLTLGILADTPRAATGMAIVNHNLTIQLVREFGNEMRIIYFARFEAEKGVAPDSSVFSGYEMVPCEGGVWKPEVVQDIIQKYRVNIVYSEDDWWSMKGLILGTKRMGVPLYFMSPIDSLPIQREALDLFKHCRIVFVPNQSYKYIPNGRYLPHAVDWLTFKPNRPKAFQKFTFLWIGRDEKRKALGRTIMAFERIYNKIDCGLVIRANWGATPMSRATDKYIKMRKLPIIQDRMANCSHDYLSYVYSSCHAYICSSKAGACEMGILEAQACGLPVLTTDWTFMCENIVHGKTGFLIPIDGYDIQRKPKEGGVTGKGRIWGNISVDKLAEKMIYLAENPKRSWKMGFNGLEHVRKNYNWRDIAFDFYEAIMNDYQNLYRKRGG